MNYFERRNKINELSEKDLARFLIWDYIDDMNDQEYRGAGKLLSANFKKLSQRYENYRIILNFIDKTYNSIIFSIKSIFKNKKREKVLFIVSNRYGSIILATKKSYDVEMIVGGEKDRLFAIKHFIRYDSYSDLNQLVYDYLTEKDELYLLAFTNNIKERIKKTRPDYVVLGNDCLPAERAVIMACRSLGIATLEIQHGIYNSSSPISTGKFADYILVWGKYFKDLYVKQNIRKPDDIYILGYPYLIKSEKIVERQNNDYIVYYFGQNLEVYNKKFLNIKIESVRGINKICNRLGMKFVYRSHPGDDRLLLKEKLPEIFFSSRKEKIEDSIAKGDIFISFNSTSLIQAAMRSKISLQLLNYPINADNFEKIGICNKTLKTLDELEKYLKEIVNISDLDKFKLNFNTDYIETRNNPDQRFLEVLDNLKSK